MPILVASDRSGTTLSAVLPAVTAEAVRAVLAPVLDKDALVVADLTSYPRCAAALGVSHEVLDQSAGERRRDAGLVLTPAAPDRTRPVATLTGDTTA